MVKLAAAMVRHRISTVFAVACAVLGAAALITGTGVLFESGLRSHLPADRLGGADVVVSAQQSVRTPGDIDSALPVRRTVRADLVGQLAQLPGVTAAVGDLSFPAAIVTGHGVVSTDDPATAGHGWSSTTLLPKHHVDGTAPHGAADVALSTTVARAAGVGIGDRVRVVAGGHTAAYRVDAVVTGAHSGVYFADPTAAVLAGRDHGVRAATVDLVGLRAAPGATARVAGEVRQRLHGTGLAVATSSGRGDVLTPGGAGSRALLVVLASSLAGTILLIVGFVLAGALAVSLNGQRRELAMLRAVGATPKQIRRLAASQASVVAGVALLPGIALGYLLAGQFRHMLVHLGMLPDGLPLTVSPLPALAAVALVAAVVQLSARASGWRLSRMPATEAVAESRSEPREISRVRTGAGLLLIVASSVLAVAPLVSRTALGVGTTSLAGIVAAIGLGLAGPAVVRTLSGALARRLPGKSSAPTWLAVANSHAYALRFAAALTTLAMAVVFVLTYVLPQTTLTAATRHESRAGNVAQLDVSATQLGGLPADVLPAIRDTPGVRSAAAVSTTTVLWPHQELGDPTVDSESALILDPAAPAVLDLDVHSGSLRALTGASVAVASDTAKTAHVGVGDHLRLILGDGTSVDPRVVAVYGRGLGFGPIAVSRDLALGHTDTGLDQSIAVRTDGSPAATRHVAALVAARPGLQLDRAEFGTSRGTPPETWINLAVVLVLLAYLLLGIANKLFATTAQRRGEIATLQLLGATPRQVRAMMRREAGLMYTGALVLGVLLSALPLALVGIGFLGRPWADGPLWLLPAVALAVAGVTAAAIEVPTRQSLRIPPTSVLT